MGVGPLLPWRRSGSRGLARALRVPVGAALLAALAAIAIGARQPVAAAAFAAVGLAVGGILAEWVRGTRSRHRRGESYPAALFNLLAGNRPRYGGYIVHLGISMLAVGAIASSFYSVQRDLAMRPDDVASLGGYTFHYIGVRHTAAPDSMQSVAAFDVYKGSDFLGRMEARRAFYPAFNIASTQGAIRSTPLEDFYIVPSEFGADDQAVFRVLINPLVWWMWASGPVMALGILVGLWPHRKPAYADLRLPSSAGSGAHPARA